MKLKYLRCELTEVLVVRESICLLVLERKKYVCGWKEGMFGWFEGRDLLVVGWKECLACGNEGRCRIWEGGGLVCLTTGKLRTAGAYFHCNDDILHIFKHLN